MKSNEPGKPREALWASNSVDRPDGSHSEAILGLENKSTGVPYPIAVRGSVKCLICEQFVQYQLICDECKQAMVALKRIRLTDGLSSLVELLHRHPDIITTLENPGTSRALEALTDEAVAETFIAKIRHHREH